MSEAILINKNVHKISRREWPKLRDLYRRNWPKHILSFYSLKIYIEWIEKNPELDMIIYTTDENWKQHGTFVLVEVNGPRINVLFNTLHASATSDLMLKALECLNKDGVFTLAAFVQQVKPVFDNFLQLECSEDVQNTLLYYMPSKEALQLAPKPKPGFQLKSLSLDDVPMIDSLWPHQYPGSEEFIRNIVRHNLTLGAYEEGTGKLCGWVMQEQIGTIGLLQVIESHKRLGLGEQLVREMIVLMAKIGMDSTATVLCTNRPSRHLFQKLGFKIIDHAYWYDQKPKQEPVTVDDPKDYISQLLLEVDCI